MKMNSGRLCYNFEMTHRVILAILVTTALSSQVYAGKTCVSDCKGQKNGDYPSCNGCNVYVTCSNGIKYDNRPCPGGLVWDDKLKNCEHTSTTCGRQSKVCTDTYGSTYKPGDTVPSGNTCKKCVCNKQGNIRCRAMKCGKPGCKNPVRLDGQCCPKCYTYDPDSEFCPRPIGFGSDKRQCDVDCDCGRSRKCCSSGIGTICISEKRNQCIYKGKAYTINRRVKDGCSLCVCQRDRTMKCYRKNCVPGTCPKPPAFGICIQRCYNDQDCKGGRKCCSNGCGRVCKMPRKTGISTASPKYPIADAGNDITIQLPNNKVILGGSNSKGNDKIIKYEWTDVSAIIQNINLYGMDKKKLKISKLIVKPAPPKYPIADAGNDITIQLPINKVTLDGSNSKGNDKIIKYEWTDVSAVKQNIKLKGMDKKKLKVSKLVEGTYTFRLTVTNEDNKEAFDEVTLTVAAEPPGYPVADAGNDITIQLPINKVTIDGSNSKGNDKIIKYEWTDVSAIKQNIKLYGMDKKKLKVSKLVEGTYTFRLTVTNGDNKEAFDDVTVIVEPAPPKYPIADAGNDITIQLPINKVTLDGSNSKGNDKIIKYEWTDVSSIKQNIKLKGMDKKKLKVSKLVEGTYTFRLTVTNEDNKEAFDDVTVIVEPAPPKYPIADAGNDITIQLPINKVTLDGSNSKGNDKIIKYEWTDVSAIKQNIKLKGMDKKKLKVSKLVEGTFTFRLTVTNEDNKEAFDEVTLTVAAEPPKYPIADAGNDITIQLPINKVTLDGSNSKGNYKIKKYEWTDVSAIKQNIKLKGMDKKKLKVSKLVEGTYTFRLTVTNEDNKEAFDDVTVIVEPAPPKYPIADAGNDITIQLPINKVTLDGSNSKGNDKIIKYEWTDVSAIKENIKLYGMDKKKLKVSKLVEGVYTFRLTVTNEDNKEAFDEVTLTVAAEPPKYPVADAGNDITIQLPINKVTLDGSNSKGNDKIIKYEWTDVSAIKQNIKLKGMDKKKLKVSKLLEGTYTFRLTVTNEDNKEDLDDVTVIVEPAPTKYPIADAGDDITIQLPINKVTLDGSNSKGNDKIKKYEWTDVSAIKQNIKLKGMDKKKLKVSKLVEGTYTFRLTVTNEDNKEAFDDVTVIVEPAPPKYPIADAGNDITIQLPINKVTLDGSNSKGNDKIIKYEWTDVSVIKQNIKLKGMDKKKLKVSKLVEGTYTFRLTVTNEDNKEAFDEVTLTVAAEPPKYPVADAGNDITIQLPINKVTLDGSNSKGNDKIKRYEWTDVSSIKQNIKLKGMDKKKLKVSKLVEGTYTFRLTVTNEDNQEAFDDVTVIVEPAPPKYPIADAGNDITIQLPINKVSLDGSNSKGNDKIIKYEWTDVSAIKQNIKLKGMDKRKLKVSKLVEGTYTFRLTVTNEDNKEAFDEVTFTVAAEPPKYPIADAGNDITIQLPINKVTLDGSNSKGNDKIIKYEWTDVSSIKQNIKLKGMDKKKLKVSKLVEGTYTFRLTVTNEDNQEAFDDVTVIVEPAPPKYPIADAGNDITIQLPINKVTLDGSNSKGNDKIIKYEWTDVSAIKENIKLKGMDKKKLKVSKLVEGTYTFRLTVTNEDNKEAFDEVTLTVAAEPPKYPVADAGNDITIQLPINKVTLDGSNSLGNDKIIKYEWTDVSAIKQNIKLYGMDKKKLKVSKLLEGTYTFRLTVTNEDNEEAFDDVTVIVEPAPPKYPIADAGNDITIQLPINKVTLDGSNSKGNEKIIKYEWTDVSAIKKNIKLKGMDKKKLKVSKLVEGTYTFRLTVTNEDNKEAFDDVTVIVEPAPPKYPIADAGNDITIQLPINKVTLDGSNSKGNDKIIKYEWTDVSAIKENIKLKGMDKKKLKVSKLVEGTYTFRLTVTNEDNKEAFDEVTLTVAAEPPKYPVADAGNDITIQLPINKVTLDGSNSLGNDKIIKYEWTDVSAIKQNIKLYGMDKKKLKVSKLLEGTYTFRLTVTNEDNKEAFDDVTVIVEPAPPKYPFADAGNDITIQLPINKVTIDGSNSKGNDKIIKYEWTDVSAIKQNIKLYGMDKKKLKVSELVVGTYSFRLTVTNEDNKEAFDDVTVIVETAPPKYPIADAGNDITIQLPINKVTLDGSNSKGNDKIIKYEWTDVSALKQNIKLKGMDKKKLKVSKLVEGTYTFRLTVTNEDNKEAFDEVTLTVAAEPPKYPVADAGNDITIQLPINKVTLDGSNSKGNDKIIKYEWTDVSVIKEIIKLKGMDKKKLKVSKLVEGTYTFRLTVTNQDNKEAFDEVTLTVAAEPPKYPVADAGNDITIQLPINKVTLDGSNSKGNDKIIKYEWTDVSAIKENIKLKGMDKKKLKVSKLVEGTYTFRLTVTNEDNKEAFDEVTLTVAAAPPKYPIADAGNDITIQLPINKVTLDGSNSKGNDKIIKYEWTDVSAIKKNIKLKGMDKKKLKVSKLVEGTYTFRLTVTNEDNKEAFDDVTVIVEPATPKYPIADAGNDITIQLPINKVTLDGSNSKGNDKIIKYEWTDVSAIKQNIKLKEMDKKKLKVSKLVEGTYTFRLTVTNEDNKEAFDEVTLTVAAEPPKYPVADAGNDITIQLPINKVTLDGSNSKGNDKIIKYEWTDVSDIKENIKLKGMDKKKLKVSKLVEGTYTFRLTVTNEDNKEAFDEVTLTVAAAPPKYPIADAGNDITIQLPINKVTLDGSNSKGNDKIIKYEWTDVSAIKKNIKLKGMDKKKLKVSKLVEGTYTFRLTVTNEDNKEAFDDVTVIVEPAPPKYPIADAGNDITIQLPINKVTLDGSNSKGNDKIIKYEWTDVSAIKENIKLKGMDKKKLKVSKLVEGTYTFRLTVTNEDNKEAFDEVTLTVAAEPPKYPVADAGNDITIQLPINKVTLDGSNSLGNDKIIKYEWTDVSAIKENIKLKGMDKKKLKVSKLVEGTYTFRLTVTNEDNKEAFDEVTLTVAAAPPKYPIADAGNDFTIQLPINKVTLDGSNSKGNDKIIKYEWTDVSAIKKNIKLKGMDKKKLKVSKLVEGTYTFRLTVTNEDNKEAFDDVTVIVEPAPPKYPIADAGNDITIQLPINKVTLDGSNSKGNDKIIKYEWTDVSAIKENIKLKGMDKKKLKVSKLVEGTYTFRLTVTNEDNKEAFDEVTLTVAAEPPKYPIADAGNDITIQLPINKVTLDGSNSKGNDKIIKYEWTDVSAIKKNIKLKGMDKKKLKVSKLVEGTYTFRLTVTNEDNKEAFDDVTVIVEPAPPKYPIADAGNDNKEAFDDVTVIVERTCKFGRKRYAVGRFSVGCVTCRCTKQLKVKCSLKNCECPEIRQDLVSPCVINRNSCLSDDDCVLGKKCCSKGCGKECLFPVKKEDVNNVKRGNSQKTGNKTTKIKKIIKQLIQKGKSNQTTKEQTISIEKRKNDKLKNKIDLVEKLGKTKGQTNKKANKKTSNKRRTKSQSKIKETSIEKSSGISRNQGRKIVKINKKKTTKAASDKTRTINKAINKIISEENSQELTNNRGKGTIRINRKKTTKKTSNKRRTKNKSKVKTTSVEKSRKTARNHGRKVVKINKKKTTKKASKKSSIIKKAKNKTITDESSQELTNNRGRSSIRINRKKTTKKTTNKRRTKSKSKVKTTSVEKLREISRNRGRKTIKMIKKKTNKKVTNKSSTKSKLKSKIISEENSRKFTNNRGRSSIRINRKKTTKKTTNKRRTKSKSKIKTTSDEKSRKISRNRGRKVVKINKKKTTKKVSYKSSAKSKLKSKIKSEENSRKFTKNRGRSSIRINRKKTTKKTSNKRRTKNKSKVKTTSVEKSRVISRNRGRKTVKINKKKTTKTAGYKSRVINKTKNKIISEENSQKLSNNRGRSSIRINRKKTTKKRTNKRRTKSKSKIKTTSDEKSRKIARNRGRKTFKINEKKTTKKVSNKSSKKSKLKSNIISEENSRELKKNRGRSSIRINRKKTTKNTSNKRRTKSKSKIKTTSVEKTREISRNRGRKTFKINKKKTTKKVSNKSSKKSKLKGKIISEEHSRKFTNNRGRSSIRINRKKTTKKTTNKRRTKSKSKIKTTSVEKSREVSKNRGRETFKINKKTTKTASYKSRVINKAKNKIISEENSRELSNNRGRSSIRINRKKTTDKSINKRRTKSKSKVKTTSVEKSRKIARNRGRKTFKINEKKTTKKVSNKSSKKSKLKSNIISEENSREIKKNRGRSSIRINRKKTTKKTSNKRRSKSKSKVKTTSVEKSREISRNRGRKTVKINKKKTTKKVSNKSSKKSKLKSKKISEENLRKFTNNRERSSIRINRKKTTKETTNKRRTKSKSKIKTTSVEKSREISRNHGRKTVKINKKKTAKKASKKNSIINKAKKKIISEEHSQELTNNRGRSSVKINRKETTKKTANKRHTKSKSKVKTTSVEKSREISRNRGRKTVKMIKKKTNKKVSNKSSTKSKLKGKIISEENSRKFTNNRGRSSIRINRKKTTKKTSNKRRTKNKSKIKTTSVEKSREISRNRGRETVKINKKNTTKKASYKSRVINKAKNKIISEENSQELSRNRGRSSIRINRKKTTKKTTNKRRTKSKSKVKTTSVEKSREISRNHGRKTVKINKKKTTKKASKKNSIIKKAKKKIISEEHSQELTNNRGRSSIKINRKKTTKKTSNKRHTKSKSKVKTTSVEKSRVISRNRGRKTVKMIKKKKTEKASNKSSTKSNLKSKIISREFSNNRGRSSIRINRKTKTKKTTNKRRTKNKSKIKTNSVKKSREISRNRGRKTVKINKKKTTKMVSNKSSTKSKLKSKIISAVNSRELTNNRGRSSIRINRKKTTKKTSNKRRTKSKSKIKTTSVGKSREISKNRGRKTVKINKKKTTKKASNKSSVINKAKNKLISEENSQEHTSNRGRSSIRINRKKTTKKTSNKRHTKSKSKVKTTSVEKSREISTKRGRKTAKINEKKTTQKASDKSSTKSKVKSKIISKEHSQELKNNRAKSSNRINRKKTSKDTPSKRRTKSKSKTTTNIVENSREISRKPGRKTVKMTKKKTTKKASHKRNTSTKAKNKMSSKKISQD